MNGNKFITNEKMFLYACNLAMISCVCGYHLRWAKWGSGADIA